METLIVVLVFVLVLLLEIKNRCKIKELKRQFNVHELVLLDEIRKWRGMCKRNTSYVSCKTRLPGCVPDDTVLDENLLQHICRSSANSLTERIVESMAPQFFSILRENISKLSKARGFLVGQLDIRVPLVRADIEGIEITYFEDPDGYSCPIPLRSKLQIKHEFESILGVPPENFIGR